MPAAGHEVLISYSHRDERTRPLVPDLAAALREDGIDAWIDRYETHPSEGWPKWMDRQIKAAKKVICLCTTPWRQDFDGEGTGRGVTWEGVLIQSALYNQLGDNDKFVPLRLATEDPAVVPDILVGHEASPIDPAVLTDRDQRQAHEPWNALIRRLRNEPELVAPPVGARRELGLMEVRSTGLNDTRDREALAFLDQIRHELPEVDEALPVLEAARTARKELLWRRCTRRAFWAGLLASATGLGVLGSQMFPPQDGLTPREQQALRDAIRLTGELASQSTDSEHDPLVPAAELISLFREHPTAWREPVLTRFERLDSEIEAYERGEVPLSGMSPEDRLAQAAMHLNRACRDLLDAHTD